MLIVRRVPRCAAPGAVPGAAPVGAGVAAAETVAAFALAHRAAGGALPGAEALLAVAVLVYAAGLVVLGRRAPLRVVLPAMVAAQLAVHAWMSVLAPPTAVGHAHHGVGVVGAAAAPAGLTWSMVAAHLAAALVTALAWHLRRRAVEVLVAWSATDPLPVPLRRGVARALSPLRAWSPWHHGTAATRGPPAPVPAPAPA
ncbi:hypothetical protein [Nocardioides sp. YIM 152588]|uniref:hypothetical protein n=1 Tax=Nocardioides sp. YIM 152588 TaxID=3158259 RepID=UPI0032E39F93